MPFTPQKVPFSVGVTGAVAEVRELARQLVGKSLPASVVEVVGGNNTIVKIKFELKSHWTLPEVTVPVIGPEWVRFPIQNGDKGMVVSCDTYLGGMSGLGGGVADLTTRGNLSKLLWLPIGNSKFTDTEDPKKTVIYGPDGVILKHPDEKAGKLDVRKDKVVASVDPQKIRHEVDNEGFKVYVGDKLKFIVNAAGAKFMSANGSFGIDITDTGTFIDGKNFLPHKHNDVQSGGSQTGVVS